MFYGLKTDFVVGEKLLQGLYSVVLTVNTDMNKLQVLIFTSEFVWLTFLINNRFINISISLAIHIYTYMLFFLELTREPGGVNTFKQTATVFEEYRIIFYSKSISASP